MIAQPNNPGSQPTPTLPNPGQPGVVAQMAKQHPSAAAAMRGQARLTGGRAGKR